MARWWFRSGCFTTSSLVLLPHFLPPCTAPHSLAGQAAAGRSGQVPSGTRASPRPARRFDTPHRRRGLQRHAIALVRWVRAALLPTGDCPSARATISSADRRRLLHHLEDPARRHAVRRQAVGGRVRGGGGGNHEGEQALYRLHVGVRRGEAGVGVDAAVVRGAGSLQGAVLRVPV